METDFKEKEKKPCATSRSAKCQSLLVSSIYYINRHFRALFHLILGTVRAREVPLGMHTPYRSGQVIGYFFAKILAIFLPNWVLVKQLGSFLDSGQGGSGRYLTCLIIDILDYVHTCAGLEGG